ncbi:protein Spindly-like [Daphnia pulicaria]|uniref:protein Spindly-like n=1 Tax=Daphnia pulicaria TaxID=35523 RepID=UPI001EEB4474|nr:protein Spindly-like [Daphnia pulicaria]
MEHSVKNCPIKKEMEKLEKDYSELQANLQLSAVYGNSLLEEINTLKHQIKSIQSLQEASVQENHNLRMQLEVSQKLTSSQNADMESLKESLQISEELNKQLKALDEEQHRKESTLVSQMANIKDQEEAHKEQYEHRIKELEAENKQLKSAERVPMVVSCNHEEEISQLQMDLELTNQSKNKVEEELISKQSEMQQFQYVESQLNKKVSEFEYELLTKEKALASSEKLLEEKRIEILELQALLEAERVSQTNPEKRGNSIFSEVEDRRQQVERQLAKLTTLLDKERRKNQDLQAEIVKVKNQMAFLACAGNNAEPSKSVEQLENLLRSTTSQNKDLLKKIEDLERKVQSSCQPVPQLEDSKKWMQAMLSQKQEEIDKLRAEIRDHIRSYLCQTDQMMQLTKRLTEAEKNLQRARGEVFRLKLKIEEMQSNENAPSTASPSYTVPPILVKENLKFLMEKKEIVSQPEKPLRERVVLENQLEQNTLNSSSGVDETTVDKEKDGSETLDIPIKSSYDEPAETLNNVEAPQCALKRQVRMNNEVHVMYEDGDTTLENLAEDKFTAGVKTSEKPVGKPVEVVDVSTAAPAMECNQQ